MIDDSREVKSVRKIDGWMIIRYSINLDRENIVSTLFNAFQRLFSIILRCLHLVTNFRNFSKNQRKHCNVMER